MSSGTFSLELEADADIQQPSAQQIQAGLATVNDQGSSFAILSRDDGAFVQTAFMEGEYVLEFQEASGAHFQVMGCGLAEVTAAFVGFAAGDESWVDRFDWSTL